MIHGQIKLLNHLNHVLFEKNTTNSNNPNLKKENLNQLNELIY